MKRVIILLFAGCFTLSGFAQITRGSSSQVVIIQQEREPKVRKEKPPRVQKEREPKERKERVPKLKPTEWQPFLLGGIEIGTLRPTSYAFRLQAGIVKRIGFYVAGTTNFSFAKADDYYCNDDSYYGYNGYNGHLYSRDILWSGEHSYTRWAIHAGPMVRLTPNFMIYVGGGVGQNYLLNETFSGQKLVKYDDKDLYGELDFGLMFRFGGHFAVSTGGSLAFQDRCKYGCVNIGLGIMF